MNIDSLKSYIAVNFAKAEADMQAKISEVVSFFEGEDTKDAALVEAEIADLRARGYSVTEPVAEPVAAAVV